MVRNWLPKKWRRFLSSKQPSRKPSRPAHYRPQLEVLEDRLVLSNLFTVTSTGDSGAGSLRAAIASANAASGPSTIDFNISGSGAQTINLLSALPTITNAVTIDGSSQPGFTAAPLIVLNGSGAGAGANGLTIAAGNSTVKDLAIDNFSGDGIELETGGNDVVTGNYIGVASNGKTAAANGSGVYIINSANNTVGAGNILSANTFGVALVGSGATGNAVEGNYIGTDVTGAAKLANTYGVVIAEGAANNTVGGTVSADLNVLSANTVSGVQIQDAGSTGNVVEGNYIGTDNTGANALANDFGVAIYSSKNTVGGTTTGAGNVLSANTYGVALVGSGATGNAVQGNYIGTDKTGTAKLGNTYGVALYGSASNTIGGTTAAALNVLSGNTFGAVIGDSGSSGNVVEGNYVGTDKTGTVALANTYGVLIYAAATNNTIGGTTAAALNVISGNAQEGVFIDGSGTTGNVVEGNYIGTDKSGIVALANTYGVYIADGSASNTVGGTTTGARNILSGNTYGVDIYGSGATGNAVEGNHIGTDASGTVNLGNAYGVVLAAGAANNAVGGTATGAANVIAYSSNDGVYVNTGTGNAIRENSIYNSGNLGIDLVNNGNNNQAAPTLTSATVNGSSITIVGTLTAADNTSYALDFFASPTANKSGAGEGQQYLGSYTVTTNASGTASINQTFNVSVPAGYFVSATATDPGGNTSEFATDVKTTTTANNLFVVTNTSDSGAGSLRQAILSANAASGPSTIDFNISGSGAQTINLASALPTITNAVVIDGASQPGFNGTPLIVLNGTNAGSGANGLTITAGSSTVENLVIDHFTGDGIDLQTGGGNVLTGNYIGVDSTGATGAANGNGVVIENGSTNNTVGGTTTAARNVLSANTYDGVYIGGSGVTGNVVEGNYIGTDYTGTAKLGNQYGVVLTAGASNNVVGGTAVADLNVISANTDSGVEIANSGSTGNMVEGNYIGTDKTGAANLGNGFGVYIVAASNNAIGGTAPGAANVIAYSSSDGVEVSIGTGNAIRENSIHDSGGVGIALVSGGNKSQAAPALTSATTTGSSITIVGSLTATANTTYNLDFFATPTADKSGNAEGQQFLGTISVTTNSSGTASINQTFNVAVPAGYVITATATDPGGNTSPFSAGQSVT